MLYRTSLAAPAFRLRREIDKLFEDTFQNADRAGWAPSVNIRETAKEFAFDVELPGLKPEQVEITCDNGVLMIRGERQEERKEGEEGRYHLVERSYGSFSRSFQLPQNVNDEAIEAEFDNGLLHVRVPKSEVPQPRRIEIHGGRGGERNQAQISGQARQEANGSTGKKSQGEQKQRGEMAGTR